jgi:predicted acylesterase/phospholipase RssA
MAIITNDRRTATVTAVRDSQLLRLPADACLELVDEHPEALRQLATGIVRRLVRSVEVGTPTSAVSTVAIVPLDLDDDVRQLGTALVESLRRFVGRATHVTSASVTRRDRARSGDLTNWFADQEADSDIVVYETHDKMSIWSDICTRQADVIVFVASSRSNPRVREMEEAVARRRENTPCRTEFVLVHPRGTRHPRDTRRWLRSRSYDRHHHVVAGEQRDIDRVARLLLGRGLGVVFSGGGARGIASLGVLRALHERRVPIDAVGGTSIGGIIATLTGLGRAPDEIVTQLKGALDRSPVDVTFPKLALATGRRVTTHLHAALGELDLEDAWRSVFCVSTNLTRGDIEIHRTGTAWRAVRATFSIPGVFPPVKNELGELLVDGGLLDNMPVGVMRTAHEGITIIAVDISRTRDLVADETPGDGIASGWEMLLRRLDPFSEKQETIGLARIMMRLTELGSETTADRGDLYIRPPIDPFGIAEFKSFDRLLAIGYEAGTKAVDEWINFGSARSAAGGHLPSFKTFTGTAP